MLQIVMIFLVLNATVKMEVGNIGILVLWRDHEQL